MRAAILSAVVSLAALTTAGCATTPGSSGGTAGNQPAASAPASPASTGPALGASAQADNGQVEATVYGYREQPGVWGAADVQVCVVRTAIFDVTVSQGPWQVLLSDGSALTPKLAGDSRAPQPGYPTDHRRVAPGQCIRGWLVFPAPANGRPVAVQYTPAGARPLTWALS